MCVNADPTSWVECKGLSQQRTGTPSATLWSICLPQPPCMNQTPKEKKKSHTLNKNCLTLLTAHYFSIH